MFKKVILRAMIPVGVMAMSTEAAAMQGDQLKRPLEAEHVNAAGHELLMLVPNIADEIQFAVGQPPGDDDAQVLLQVAAAFTGEDLTTVCGNHVVAGTLMHGYSDVTCTGHLLVAGHRVAIKPNSELDASIATAVEQGGFLFQQCLIVEDGVGQVERIPQAIRDRRAHIIYRAACIMADGSFAVIQGLDKMYCHEFIDALVALGAKQALYLDMGTWAYGWYRERNADPVIELAPHFDNTRHQTNWLIIRSYY